MDDDTEQIMDDCLILIISSFKKGGMVAMI